MVVWAVKRFFLYLFGRKFTLYSDNKPIVQILHPDKNLPALSSTRMLHYSIFLAAFDYTVKHRPVRYNANADFLSRLPVPAGELDSHEIMHLETTSCLPIDLRTIRQETGKDPEMSSIMHHLRTTSAVSYTHLTLPTIYSV